MLIVSQGAECASDYVSNNRTKSDRHSYPTNIYLFKVNNRNTKKGVKYVQS